MILFGRGVWSSTVLSHTSVPFFPTPTGPLPMSHRLALSVFAGLIVGFCCLDDGHAAKGGKPGGGNATRTISVEWRKDSFVPPEIRTLAEDGTGMTTVNGSPNLG